MATAKEDSTSYVQAIRFTGYGTGLVKTLSGFKKSQHSVPDAVNASTLAFLARLASQELSEDAEKLFQEARAQLNYKRKDLSLDLSPPNAVLTAKDFTYELSYGFDGEDSTAYRQQWSLSGFTELEFLRGEACNILFSGRFSELVFSLTKGARIEEVIDAVENLDSDTLRVDYPSDCSHCMLSVEGLDARVRFDGAEMAMLFARAGSPVELLDGFLTLRHAFSLTKSKELSGLLGEAR